jgi:hypothetical protein
MNKSPAGPPFSPAPPLPCRRTRCPELIPAGISTSYSTSLLLYPLPKQCGHLSLIIFPRP